MPSKSSLVTQSDRLQDQLILNSITYLLTEYRKRKRRPATQGVEAPALLSSATDWIGYSVRISARNLAGKTWGSAKEIELRAPQTLHNTAGKIQMTQVPYIPLDNSDAMQLYKTCRIEQESLAESQLCEHLKPEFWMCSVSLTQIHWQRASHTGWGCWG